jgi:hypothetical protein
LPKIDKCSAGAFPFFRLRASKDADAVGFVMTAVRFFSLVALI